MTARIPDGMSPVDVFYALYQRARISKFTDPRFDGHPGSPYYPHNMIQLFNHACLTGSCWKVRGKALGGVDFCNLAPFNTSAFDLIYCKGAAQEALDKAERLGTVHTELCGDPCTYYSRYWWSKTPDHLREDLQPTLEHCMQRQNAEESLQEKMSRLSLIPASLVPHCHASYEVGSRTDAQPLQRTDTPCDAAIKEMSDFVEQKRRELLINNLSICKQNGTLSLLRNCVKEQGPLSLMAAKLALENTQQNK